MVSSFFSSKSDYSDKLCDELISNTYGSIFVFVGSIGIFTFFFCDAGPSELSLTMLLTEYLFLGTAA